MDQLCLLSLSSCVCSSVPFISDSTVSGVPTLHRSPPIIDHRSPITDHRSPTIDHRVKTKHRSSVWRFRLRYHAVLVPPRPVSRLGGLVLTGTG